MGEIFYTMGGHYSLMGKNIARRENARLNRSQSKNRIRVPILTFKSCTPIINCEQFLIFKYLVYRRKYFAI